MADDLLLNKAAIIERCLKRIEEEYRGREIELEVNFTRQDAIILNLLRACEASIDGAMYIVRERRLGLPQESRDAFRKLNLAILRSILENRLGDFRTFVHTLITAQGG